MQVVIVICGLIHRIVDLRIWNLNPADNLVVYCLKSGPVNNWGLVFFLGNCCVCRKLFVDDVLLVVLKLGLANHNAGNNQEANANYQQERGKNISKTLLLSGLLARLFRRGFFVVLFF